MVDEETWELLKKGAEEVLEDEETEGVEWVEKAIPELIALTKEIKEIEEEKEEKTRGKKMEYDAASKPYLKMLGLMKKVSDELRERVKKEYEGTETIEDNEGNEIVFPETWGWEVVDIAKVERRYLKVDEKMVNEEVKKGIRKIKGIEVKKVKGIQVRIKKEE